ncbi:MAG TPA: DUF1800 domain-containing protein [Terracidiphilus sp.]|nr:DUF1800 domain-containing protein [Terracidiphilus sp.]
MLLAKQALASALCVSLAAPYGVWAETPARTAAKRLAYQAGQMQGDQRILHALNRFTFGPRPGDVDAVRGIGLEAWFEQQLHPQALDLSDLNARLAKYSAMQLNEEALLARFPSNALVRQAIDGKITPPKDGVDHAIWADAIARQQVKREEKKQAEAAKAAQSGTMTPDAAPVMASGEAPATEALNQAALNSLLDLPADARLAQLTALPQPVLDATLKALRPIERVQLVAGMAPEQKEAVAALEGPERLVAEELIAARLTRELYSAAQLQEVMTDFWLNHFNVFLRKNETMPYALVSYERDVIRPRALGRFEDLLEATAHSPAMLMYLDNAESMGPDSFVAERAARRANAKKKAPEGLNENYARELMELHTVGVNGGYTQADVTEVARMLTGWTLERPQRGGGFIFDADRHEPGTKHALGLKWKEDGETEGRDLLHYLATRPQTAQFISRKLAVRFVADDPPQALVDRMATTYLQSGGDIAEVLRTLFHAPEFWTPSLYHAKVKTPLEYVLSAARASDVQIDNLRPLANELRDLGMPMYGCVPPTGWDAKGATWVSTGALVDRMNFALNLAANRLPGVTSAWTMNDTSVGTMISTGAPTPENEEARLEPMLVPGGLSETTRAAVLQQFNQQMTQAGAAQALNASVRPNLRAMSTQTERQDQVLAGLLLGSPEFQRR